MADFQTHITTSTVLGIEGGLAAHAFYELTLPSCILAGGLCSIAGMLPDLDSDSGVPLRESIAFAAAIIPMMLLERFAKWGFGFEATILVSAMLYLVVRFGVAELLKNYTVHRGMFHSIPAALIAAELTFLIFDNENVSLRFLNAGAVFTGFMSHLVLDELWSVDVNWGLVRFKSSFGSALKFWGDNAWANFSTYGKLVLLTLLMTHDPAWNNVVEPWMTGRPIVNQDKAWSQQLANWRQRFFQQEYGAIPPNAVDHPWNPSHPQSYLNGGTAPFAQQYPNFYPPQANDPARPFTSGTAYPTVPQNNFLMQNYTQPQAYNSALPFTNPQQYNMARLPENYQSHAPASQNNQYPATTSPYQMNPSSPSRPSMNPQNWQLPQTPPSMSPPTNYTPTNSLHYQSSSSATNPWVAQDWNGATNFTQLGAGLTPNYQNGMMSVSHGYGSPPTQWNQTPWNQSPYGNSATPYNTGTQNTNSALDRFPSLQR